MSISNRLNFGPAEIYDWASVRDGAFSRDSHVLKVAARLDYQILAIIVIIIVIIIIIAIIIFSCYDYDYLIFNFVLTFWVQGLDGSAVQDLLLEVECSKHCD